MLFMKTSNVKKTWGIINELTSRKQNNSHVKEIKLNGSSVSDPPGLVLGVLWVIGLSLI